MKRTALRSETIFRNKKQKTVDRDLWLNQLFHEIECGRTTNVNHMIEEMDQHDSMLLKELLSKKIRYTDCVGRAFHEICALEFSRWHLNTPIQKIIENHFSTETAKTILDNLAANGTKYDISQKIINFIKDTYTIDPTCIVEPTAENKNYTINEKYFEQFFIALQNSMKNYIDIVQEYKSIDPDDEKKMEILMDDIAKKWKIVSILFWLLPAPFINVYCSNLPFNPIPNFEIVPVQPISLYHDAKTGKIIDWYADIYRHDTGNKSKFPKCGLYKGNQNGCISPAERGPWAFEPMQIDLDLAVLTSLHKAMVNGSVPKSELEQEWNPVTLNIRRM